MSGAPELARNYRAAFLRFLPRQDEAARHSAYLIGRAAVAEGLSILDVAQVHHDIFLEVLRETRAEELTAVATGASDFFLEVLATYDMTQRGIMKRPARGAGQSLRKP